MDLQQFLNSRQGALLGLGIGRVLPPKIGRQFTRSLASWLASKKDLPLVQAVRANQWVISGCTATSTELDKAVLESLQVIAYSLYEMFHYYGKPTSLQKLIHFSPEVLKLIDSSHQPLERGLILCGIHTSNFDLALQATMSTGLNALALTMPDATEAIEWQHDLRRKIGIQVLPATMANLRQVINYLEAGGIVITGVDRPLPDTKCCPRFFGRPAHVPVHYVQLAMRSGAQMAILGPIQKTDGLYHFVYSDLIDFQPHSNRNTALLENAERVLGIAEGFIRQAPQQWSISQAAWPEAVFEMP